MAKKVSIQLGRGKNFRIEDVNVRPAQNDSDTFNTFNTFTFRTICGLIPRRWFKAFTENQTGRTFTILWPDKERWCFNGYIIRMNPVQPINGKFSMDVTIMMESEVVILRGKR